MSGHLFRILGALFRIRVLRRPSPLFVLWNVTFNCNLKCQYCGVHEAVGEEITTDEAKDAMDALWDHGVRWITFGGGEPLFRKDIVEWYRYAHDKGFTVYTSTNGWLLPNRIEALKYLDHVNISIDGTAEIHDSIRGVGAFEKAAEAVRLCREHHVQVSLMCVLANHNLHQIGEVLDFARANKTTVAFQPATTHLNTSVSDNPVMAPAEPYRAAIERLIAEKRRGAPIRNSTAGLRHLANWPSPTRIYCAAGLSSVVIEPNGQIIGCHHRQIQRFLERRGRKFSVRQEFPGALGQVGCDRCWCANLVELNLITAMKPGPIMNVLMNRG